MLTLYDYGPSGNGYKARLVMAMTGRTFRRVECDILTGITRTPDYLALNPDGRIPFLVLADGTVLPESNAICWYLAETAADGPALIPADPMDRAQMLRWMCFEQYSHEPNIAVLRFWHHLPAMTPTQAAQVPERRAKGEAALAVMDGHLAGRDWFVGDRPTLADIALYAYTHVAEEGGFALHRYPAVGRWLHRFAALPGHVAITDPIGLDAGAAPAGFATAG